MFEPVRLLLVRGNLENCTGKGKEGLALDSNIGRRFFPLSGTDLMQSASKTMMTLPLFTNGLGDSLVVFSSFHPSGEQCARKPCRNETLAMVFLPNG
ncbi:MAG TPA: hypothetical protein DCP63_02910 [Bacteroidetes bacterium]|nr:hypothetical protein [Bacteroidota bacterium]